MPAGSSVSEPAELLPVGLCTLVAANCAAAHSVPISDSCWGPQGKQQAECPLSSRILVNELVLEVPEDNNMACQRFIIWFYNWI